MQAGEPLPRLLLVAEPGVLGLEAGEERAPGSTRHEGQPHLNVRPLEPGRLILDEAAHQPMHEGVGRLKSGNEELLQAGLDVLGKEGGQHVRSSR